MANSTIREIEIGIDMRALSMEDPDMYERIVSIFFGAGDGFQGFGTADYHSLVEIVSKIDYIRCCVEMTGNFEITAEIIDMEQPASEYICYNGNELYYMDEVIGCVNIGDMAMIRSNWKRDRNNIKVYQYIVDKAGVEIRDFKLVEKMITGIEKERIS